MTTGKKPNNNKPLHKLKKVFFEAFPLLAFAYEQQLGCVNCVQQLELAKIMFAFSYQVHEIEIEIFIDVLETMKNSNKK